MKIVTMIFLLVGLCVSTLVNAASISNPVDKTSMSFYVKNEKKLDFAKVIIQSTKDGANIYQSDFSCKATEKICTFEIANPQIIKKRITLLFLQSNGKIVSAYILAGHKIAQSNIIIPSDYYLGRYAFRQIKIEYKDVQKDDVYDKLKKQSGDAHYTENYKNVFDGLAFAVKNKLTLEDLTRGGFIKQFDPANLSKVSE